MAFLQGNFFSKTLKSNVPFNVVLPMDRFVMPGQEDPGAKTMKTLILLHGYTGNYMDWICSSRVLDYASKYNIAVIMPSGSNNFYLDDVDGEQLYGEFVGRELLEVTRKMFPLSTKREDTFIGGFSMGGYGAIRTGLKYSENFKGIIALSSALITYQAAEIKPDFKGPAGYNYYVRVFGDLNKVMGSDKDPEKLILDMKKNNVEIPEIFMACGTEDFLIEPNRRYHDFLVSQGVNVNYVEAPGVHDWNFWDPHSEKAMKWIVDITK